jgi:hypothetical protein
VAKHCAWREIGPDGTERVSLEVGEPKEDDQVIAEEERELLRISRVVSEALDGCVIRPVRDLDGVGLSIRPPYAEGYGVG